MGDLNSAGKVYMSSDNGTDYKEILNHIKGVQNYFKELTLSFTEYNAKNALARDKSYEVAKCLNKCKNEEPFTTTSQYAVELAADVIRKVGHHQTEAILRVEKKVLPNLTTYKTICKCLMREVTSAVAAQSRVLTKKKLVKAFKANSGSRYRKATPDAEKEFLNAIHEYSRVTSLLQEQVVKFEHKRLMDLKESLESFFKIQIAKHAKSIELLTDGYRFIHSIDENADLEVLKKHFKLNKVFPNRESSYSVLEKSPKKNSIESNDSWEQSDDDYNTDEETDTDGGYGPPIHNRRKVIHGSTKRPQNIRRPKAEPDGNRSKMFHPNDASCNATSQTSLYPKQQAHWLHEYRSTKQIQPDIIKRKRSGSLSLARSDQKLSGGGQAKSSRSIERISSTNQDDALWADKKTISTRAASSHGHRPFQSLAESALKSARRPYTSPNSPGRRVTFNEAVESQSNNGRKESGFKGYGYDVKEQYRNQKEKFGNQSKERKRNSYA